jgi:hypothetical protein
MKAVTVEEVVRAVEKTVSVCNKERDNVVESPFQPQE